MESHLPRRRAPLFTLVLTAFACGSSEPPAEPSPSAGTSGASGGAAGTSAAGGSAGAPGAATAGAGGSSTEAPPAPGGSGGNAGGNAGGGGAEPPSQADGGPTPADAEAAPVADAAPMPPGAPLTNPAPGQYGTRARLLEPNSEMAVAGLDGKVYVLGGYPSSRETQRTLQIYDVATDTWKRGMPSPLPLHHPVLIGVDGLLYSLGGQPDTNLTLVYDPQTDTWAEKARMPTARGAGAAANIGDKIYVVGGRPPAGNAFEVYDISDNAWTELPDLPQAQANRNHLAVAALRGKIYVAGGRYNGGNVGSPLSDSLDIFDPTTNQWAKGKSLLRPRGGLAAVVAFGCFHTYGGEGSNIGEPNGVFPDHDVYDPRTDTWTSLPKLPTPFHGVTGGAFVDGIIFMPGGGIRSGGNSGQTIHQVYRPAMRCDE